MLVLKSGGGRPSLVAASHLAAPVPTPINTPSLRKEHNGQDVGVSLVPSGRSGWGSGTSEISASEQEAADAVGKAPRLPLSSQDQREKDAPPPTRQSEVPLCSSMNTGRWGDDAVEQDIARSDFLRTRQQNHDFPTLATSARSDDLQRHPRANEQSGECGGGGGGALSGRPSPRETGGAAEASKGVPVAAVAFVWRRGDGSGGHRTPVDPHQSRNSPAATSSPSSWGFSGTRPTAAHPPTQAPVRILKREGPPMLFDPKTGTMVSVEARKSAPPGRALRLVSGPPLVETTSGRPQSTDAHIVGRSGAVDARAIDTRSDERSEKATGRLEATSAGNDSVVSTSEPSNATSADLKASSVRAPAVVEPMSLALSPPDTETHLVGRQQHKSSPSWTKKKAVEETSAGLRTKAAARPLGCRPVAANTEAPAASTRDRASDAAPTNRRSRVSVGREDARLAGRKLRAEKRGATRQKKSVANRQDERVVQASDATATAGVASPVVSAPRLEVYSTIHQDGDADGDAAQEDTARLLEANGDNDNDAGERFATVRSRRALLLEKRARREIAALAASAGAGDKCWLPPTKPRAKSSKHDVPPTAVGTDASPSAELPPASALRLSSDGSRSELEPLSLDATDDAVAVVGSCEAERRRTESRRRAKKKPVGLKTPLREAVSGATNLKPSVTQTKGRLHHPSGQNHREAKLPTAAAGARNHRVGDEPQTASQMPSLTTKKNHATRSRKGVVKGIMTTTTSPVAASVASTTTLIPKPAASSSSKKRGDKVYKRVYVVKTPAPSGGSVVTSPSTSSAA